MSPHIFSLGFVIYWFHTNLSPHILQQNCAHAATYLVVCVSNKVDLKNSKRNYGKPFCLINLVWKC